MFIYFINSCPNFIWLPFKYKSIIQGKKHGCGYEHHTYIYNTNN